MAVGGAIERDRAEAVAGGWRRLVAAGGEHCCVRGRSPGELRQSGRRLAARAFAHEEREQRREKQCEEREQPHDPSPGREAGTVEVTGGSRRRAVGKSARRGAQKENGGRCRHQPPLRRASRSSALPPCGFAARPFVSAWLDALATEGHCVALPLSSGSPRRGCLRIRDSGVASGRRLRCFKLFRRPLRVSGGSSAPRCLGAASPAFPPPSPLPATQESSHGTPSRASGKCVSGPVDNEDNGDGIDQCHRSNSGRGESGIQPDQRQRSGWRISG